MSLPDGTRLLHIGPFKTGTTTVQAAFDQSRRALARQGVVYAGDSTQPMAAALAATGRHLATSTLAQGTEQWQQLLAQTRESDARAVVLSSEFFSQANPAQIRDIVEGLGPRTHVVVTVRPLVRLLASQWQQYMQNRPSVRYDDSLDYEDWLRLVLDDPEQREITPSFWERHRHDRLVAAWAEVAGVDNLTVIVVDESDKRMVLAAFEELLALTPGTLAAHQRGANRSLTLPEQELLRAFNAEFLREGWSARDYTKLVRFGAIRHLQRRRPAAGEPGLLTPPWAVDQVVGIGSRMAANIAASGVRVVGDLDLLGDPSVATNVGENPAQVEVPAEIVARLAAGLIAEFAWLSLDPAQGRVVGELEERAREWKRRHLLAQGSAVLDERLDEARAARAGVLRVGEIGRAQLARVLLGRIRQRLVGR